VKPCPVDSKLAARIVDGDFHWSDGAGAETFSYEAAGGKKKKKDEDEDESKDGGDQQGSPSTSDDAAAAAAAAATRTPASTTLSPTLSNINLNVAKGKLTCIVGKVASGKSSLLAGATGTFCSLFLFAACLPTV